MFKRLSWAAVLLSVCFYAAAAFAKPTLLSIAVSPSGASVPVGRAQQFTATGTYSNGTTADVTKSVAWTTSNAAIATVNTSGLASGKSAGSVQIIATSGTVSGSATLQVTAPLLTLITVSPSKVSIFLGTTEQFTATGTYSDGSTAIITNSVLWTSSAPSVASVSSSGLAQGLAAGSATITATSGSIAGKASLSVTLPKLVSISISPSSPSVQLGQTVQFTATGTYSDNTAKDLTTSVTWNSSNTAVATINSSGLAKSLAQGKTTISASDGGITSNTTMTVTPRGLVSIAITPANATIPLGTSQQFTATGTYTDGSTQNLTSTATWSSSATDVATISSTGLATSHAQGVAGISASSGGIVGQTTLTVSNAALLSIAVTPTSATIPLGTTQQYAATGIFSDGSTKDITTVVTWTSSSPAIATFSVSGLASAKATGSTSVTASVGSLTSNSASLTVVSAALQSLAITPTNNSIALGTSQQFTAIGTFTDGSTQDLTTSVAWSSSSTAIATIATTGLAKSAAVGATTINATSGTVIGSTTLTVSPAQLVSIAITPAIPSIPLGTGQQFTATGTFTDNTTQDLTTTAHWGSSDASIATISNSTGSNGLSTSVGIGTTTITASSNSISGSTTLTVTAAALVSIILSPTSPSIASGTTQQFTATGTYTDSTTQNLTSTATWSSSNTTIATIDSNGLAHGTAAGTTTLSATVGSSTGSTTLTVTPAALVSITVTPSAQSIPLGTTQQFAATGNYADGTTQDLSVTVHWGTSDGTVATISNASGTAGRATGLAVGTVTVTATLGTVSGTAMLEITSAQLTSIAISPQNPTIALGRSQQFAATGTYTDQSTIDITTNVTWSSSSATVAVVSNSIGSQGLAASSGTGSTTITATMGTVSANTTLTVGAAQLVSITVTPSNPTLAAGNSLQFTATGTYTDNSTSNLTNAVTWSSSNSAIASISQAGNAIGVRQGSTTISATSGSVIGSTTLTVSTPVLTSLKVSPLSASVPLGATQQFTATAIYSDSSSQDVTNAASWSSSNTNIATINSSGLSTTVAQGVTSIGATYGGQSASTNLTVGPASLISIAITPTSATLSAGSYLQFTATGTYTNGTSANISNLVSWSSSNTSLATIDPTGLAHSLNAGAVIITATSGTVRGTASLTITAVTSSWNLIQHPKSFTCTSTTCSVTSSPTTAGSLLVLWSAVRYLGTGYSRLMMMDSVTDNGTAETWTHCPNSTVNDAYSSDGVVFALDCWYVPSAAGGATSVTAHWQLGGFTSPSQQVDLALQEYATPGTVYYDTGNGRMNPTSCSSCTGPAGLLSGTSDMVTQAAIDPIGGFVSPITGISSPYSSLFDGDSRIYAAFSGATGQSSYSVPTWTSAATGPVSYDSTAAFSTNSTPARTANMFIDFSGCTSGAAPTTTCMANSTFSGWGSSQDTATTGAGVKICTSGPTSSLPAPVTVDGVARVGNGTKNLCGTTNASGTGIGRYIIGLNGAYAPITAGYTFRSTCPASGIDCGAVLRLGDSSGGWVTVHISPLGAGNICLESVNGGSCQSTGVAYVAGKDYRFNVQGAGVSGTVDRLTVCDDATGAVLGTATATSTANPGGYHSVEPGISGEEPNVAGYNYYFRNIVLGGKYSTTGCF